MMTRLVPSAIEVLLDGDVDSMSRPPIPHIRCNAVEEQELSEHGVNYQLWMRILLWGATRVREPPTSRQRFHFFKNCLLFDQLFVLNDYSLLIAV